MDTARYHAMLDEIVAGAEAAAHDHESDKVENLKAHAATMHMRLDDITGVPHLLRMYDELPEIVPGLAISHNGKSVRERLVVAKGEFVGETYDPMKHDRAAGSPPPAPAPPGSDQEE